MKFVFSFLVLGVMLIGQPALSKPNYVVNFDLAHLGFKVFDPTVSIKERSKNLDKYFDHKHMKVALERYSNKKRPPENRVDKSLFKQFVEKVWNRDFEKVTNPRMKYILKHYRWGINNLGLVRSDVKSLESKIEIWLNKATNRIPWNTPAADLGTKPAHIVFLFDPGGSYPWVTEDENNKYIFVDVLQVRGFNDEERKKPLNTEVFSGFLVHEVFHLFQHDRNESKVFADWLLKAAVGEGSACLIGNNMASSTGKKLYPDEPEYLGGIAKKEWETRIQTNRKRIDDFIALYSEWKGNPPSEKDRFGTLMKEGWMAGPSNGLLMGDVYRVGAEMLLDIKAKHGDKKFYEVIGDSSQLISEWKKTVVK